MILNPISSNGGASPLPNGQVETWTVLVYRYRGTDSGQNRNDRKETVDSMAKVLRRTQPPGLIRQVSGTGIGDIDQGGFVIRSTRNLSIAERARIAVQNAGTSYVAVQKGIFIGGAEYLSDNLSSALVVTKESLKAGLGVTSAALWEILKEFWWIILLIIALVLFVVWAKGAIFG